MSSKMVTLPEKTYYSVAEISERWGCAIEQTMHYINEGLIRPAIKASEIRMLNLYDMAELVQKEARQGRQFFVSPGHEMSDETKQNIIFTDVVEVGKFLYIASRHVTRIGTQKVVLVLEDFQSKEYGLFDLFNLDCLPTHDISHLFFSDGFDYQNRHCQLQFTWNLATVMVTREERDRFEQNHSLLKMSAPSLLNYTTPYLGVMSLAIAEFFEPRRPVDPKRKEVEAWIAERLDAAGTEGSARIASAMFTIIKPSDHNPRKRRG